MSEDANLSDFAGSSDGEDSTADDRLEETTVTEEASADEEGCADNEASVDRDEETSADAVVSRTTYAWGEYTCERCEQPANRVWRDDDAIVCSACKEW